MLIYGDGPSFIDLYRRYPIIQDAQGTQLVQVKYAGKELSPAA